MIQESTETNSCNVIQVECRVNKVILLSSNTVLAVRVLIRHFIDTSAGRRRIPAAFCCSTEPVPDQTPSSGHCFITAQSEHSTASDSQWIAKSRTKLRIPKGPLPGKYHVNVLTQ